MLEEVVKRMKFPTSTFEKRIETCTAKFQLSPIESKFKLIEFTITNTTLYIIYNYLIISLNFLTVNINLQFQRIGAAMAATPRLLRRRKPRPRRKRRCSASAPATRLPPPLALRPIRLPRLDCTLLPVSCYWSLLVRIQAVHRCIGILGCLS